MRLCRTEHGPDGRWTDASQRVPCRMGHVALVLPFYHQNTKLPLTFLGKLDNLTKKGLGSDFRLFEGSVVSGVF